ncbi:TRAP transporter small permease subunit [Sinorhizobium fredii]|uniref:TRAP transporter small permease subunit n=1 Tax=Rhizobium fredii TaxID=380 RepID=UPI0004BCC6BF|nr:TRAP transporter small permease subunit [Sinorhizobium fredii]UTY48510.1 TRAP transporter small permease subunit [Sinorhizobium fredii]
MSKPAPPFSPAAFRAIKIIDGFTEKFVLLVAVLTMPLVLSNTVEVVSRYVFSSPTIWAADATVMSYGAIFMLGSSYALLKGAHVRTDIFWESFSDRKKGAIDAVCYVALFLPVMAIIFYMSLDDFLYSYEINEKSTLSLWMPVIWPLRGVIPLTAVLLFLQGISELLKSLFAVTTGRAFETHEKIEI